MKKISLVLAVFLALGNVSPLLAQEDSNSGSLRLEFEAKRAEILRKIEENRERLKENREKIEDSLRKDVKEVNGVVKEEVRSIREEKRGDDEDDRWNSIEVRALVSVRIFEATIERLYTLVERVDSRIDKLEDQGASTTEAVSFVNAAKANLENAELHIENIKDIDLSYSSSTASSTATTTLKINFDKLKDEVKMAREELVEAKQNLMKALNVLKRIEVGIKINATTTLDINGENDDD